MGLTPDEIVARVTALAPDAIPAPEELVRGQAVVVVPRERVLDALRALRDDSGLAFDVLADLTVVDYLGREPRFEVIYQLNSLSQHHRVRVKAGVPGDDPSIRRELILVHYGDGTADLWNSNGDRPLLQFTLPETQITAVAFGIFSPGLLQAGGQFGRLVAKGRG